jgi:hypothetical protein
LLSPDATSLVLQIRDLRESADLTWRLDDGAATSGAYAPPQGYYGRPPQGYYGQQPQGYYGPPPQRYYGPPPPRYYGGPTSKPASGGSL